MTRWVRPEKHLWPSMRSFPTKSSVDSAATSVAAVGAVPGAAAGPPAGDVWILGVAGVSTGPITGRVLMTSLFWVL